MAKFKKGDRVRLVGSHFELAAGSVGTVLEDNEVTPFVSWDGCTGGHDAYGRVNDDSAWAADEKDLEPIAPEADKPAQPATSDPVAILVACGIITPTQADAARALAGVQ